jgi:hypothetical protein
MKIAIALAVLSLSGTMAHAAMLFQQPATGSGAMITAGWSSPDGSDADTWIYDSFKSPVAATATEIDFRGNTPAVGKFIVEIYSSIGGGSQPAISGLPNMDVTGSIRRYTVTSIPNTPAGTFGGVPMADYRFALPTPLPLDANANYWLLVAADTPAFGIATATGGNGTHFVYYVGGPYFQYASGDVAFSVLGTPAPEPSSLSALTLSAAVCLRRRRA